MAAEEEKHGDRGGKREEEAYCVCRKAATDPESMVTCMNCRGWFHVECVLPRDSDISLLSKYFCAECQQSCGKQIKWKGKGKKKRKQADNGENEKKEGKEPKRAKEDPEASTHHSEKRTKHQQEPVRRSLRSRVKHNYSELNDGAEQNPTDRSIVVDYVKMLKKAKAMKSDAIPHKIRGEDLTVAFLSENGFRDPMIVDDLESLDMKMPPSTITVNRIKELVGMSCSCMHFAPSSLILPLKQFFRRRSFLYLSFTSHPLFLLSLTPTFPRSSSPSLLITPCMS